jgi:predicted ArsR family transcriptional regulator
MKRPKEGTIQARVLELLLAGSLKLDTACKKLGLEEKQVRSAIDKLRDDNGWKIKRVNPFEWALA